MATEVRITFSDERYAEVEAKAKAAGKTVNDYIRDAVSTPEVTVVTPAEAVERALRTKQVGETFILPELFTKEEWATLGGRSLCGVLGRRFFKYCAQNDCGIECTGTRDMKTKAAVYRRVK